MAVTAKVKLLQRNDYGEGDNRQVGLVFGPDYADGRNAAWALYTPMLRLEMTVRGDLANAQFPREGTAWTLTFEPDGDVEALTDAPPVESEEATVTVVDPASGELTDVTPAEARRQGYDDPNAGAQGLGTGPANPIAPVTELPESAEA